MKNKFYTFLFALFLVTGNLAAQSVPQGISYQGVARDETGQPMGNKEVALRISLTTEQAFNSPFFSEEHQVITDSRGYFSLVIGQGDNIDGLLDEVPWAEELVWMNVEMKTEIGAFYKTVSTSQLMSVPYAFHAESASKLVDDNEVDLRSGNSIYWTTTGNEFTRPPYHFLGTRDNKPLYFKTNNDDRVVITENGQVKIFSGVGTMNGDSDQQYANYPLTIQGSEQGIYIKVNGSRSSANNFVTFADGGPGDGDGTIWGRIEGQTLQELYDSPSYKTETALFALGITSLGAQVAALGAEAAGLGASGICATAAVGVIAQGVGFAAELAALTTERDGYITNTVNSVGVAYQSGGADYAEWLLREKEERDLVYGEIVGVRAGKISLNTQLADHLMVISRNPIVLGNAPQPEDEEKYEKVAFMGQVAVRVVGPVSMGDYIIPSGNHDGFGIAVHPDNMLSGDYARIIGVSWETAKDAPLNIVNVAVGINANDLSEKVEVLNARVDNILGYLKGEEPLLTDEGVQLALNNVQNQPQSAFVKAFTDDEYDAMLELNRPLYEYIFDQAQRQFTSREGSFAQSAELQSLFADPIQYLKDLRRNHSYTTQWGRMDQKFIKEGH